MYTDRNTVHVIDRDNAVLVDGLLRTAPIVDEVYIFNNYTCAYYGHDATLGYITNVVLKEFVVDVYFNWDTSDETGDCEV